MQRTKSKLLSILLILVMLLSLLPTTALAASPDASNVYVDGGKNFYNSTRLYYKNGDPDGSFTGTSTEFNAAYEPSTGTLTLKGYNGKGIKVGGVGRTDITVVLIGTNTINDGSLEHAVGGNITITSDSGGKLSITRTLSNGNPAIGIETGWATSYETGNVTITGDAKVTIDMTHNGTQGFDKAYGIFAKQNITISGDASVDITCKTPNNTAIDASNCNGLRAVKDMIIDTSGEVKINVKEAGQNDAYSIGVYPSGNAILTKVGDMEVEWKNHGSNTSYTGGAIYGDVSFDTTTHAVNVDTNKCYASYRYGTPYYTVTVKNGTLTGPGVKYANGSGNFLENDTVNIKPDIKKGNSGEEIPFQKWTSEDVTFTSPTTENNSFTVPVKNVTVTATHSPFVGKPTFTRESEANGTIAFKTAVKPNDGTEFFQYVEVGKEDDGYSYNSLSSQPTPTNAVPPYEYSVSASTYNTTVITYLDPGNYRMAVTLNGERYLSDPFKVDYTAAPTPAANISLSETGTVDFGSMEAGYTTAPAAKTVTITNSGTADTGPLTITVEGANPTAFTVYPSNIKNIAASGKVESTVRPAKDLPAGIYTATLKISGDNVNTLRRNVKFIVKDPNASAAVSGTITSYGDTGENVTVTLTKQDETTTAFTDTLTGVPGTAPYSQNYSFATVPAGTYTLKVEKKGHAPWTEEITVATDNIGKDVTVYLWGDVNRDGDVDLYDLLTLQQYLAKNITLTETQLLISDVTKDDKVDLYDLLTLQQYLARNITSFD